MTRLLASIAALALVAAQASAAPTNDTPKMTKASLPCSASAKAVKVTKTARVENRCEMEDHHISSTALVFGAAAVAGVVAIAVSTNGDHGNGTSP